MSNTMEVDTYAVAMNLLTAGLGFFDSIIPYAMQEYLASLLVAAQSGLLERGIDINPEKIPDATLLAMYAEWLYRKKATGAAMPDMLKAEIRTRQVGKAVSDCGETL